MSEIGPGGDLDPLQQAAVLLLSMGEEEAATILQYLEPREIQRISSTMATLGTIPKQSIQQVVDTFLQVATDQSGLAVGAEEYLKRMLVSALGEQKATNVMERIGGGDTAGLEKLRWMDPRAIADFMQEEHPQIQATILSYLEPDQAGEVMSYITDPKASAEVLMRVAQLESISPTALQELSIVLEQRVAQVNGSRFAQLGGSRAAAEIMNNLSQLQEEVLNNIREVDEALSDQIQEQMFVFDNLMLVDDRGIQTLLREVSTEHLMLGLKGADQALVDKIFGNMSKRAAELLQDDMEAKGPVKVSEVEEAQREILLVARKLADEGEIVLGGAGGEQML